MDISMLIERTAKYLDKMQKRLSLAQNRNAPASDIENLKINVDYYFSLLSILKRYDFRRELISQAIEKLGDENARIIVQELGITDLDERNMTCCCPFHFHQGNHVFIYNKKGFFFTCFGGCNRSYDILDVFMYKGATYLEACKKLFELAELPYMDYKNLCGGTQ